MKKERKDQHFIKKAYFKGGSKALEQFILSNLQYPQAAFDNGIEGTVHAKYDIDFKGRVIAVHLLNSVGYGCDEEAIRLIKLLTFEVPRIKRGVKVVYHKEIHIHFRLPKPVSNPPSPEIQMTYNYTITPSGSKENPSKGGYEYTVKIDTPE